MLLRERLQRRVNRPSRDENPRKHADIRFLVDTSQQPFSAHRTPARSAMRTTELHVTLNLTSASKTQSTSGNSLVSEPISGSSESADADPQEAATARLEGLGHTVPHRNIPRGMDAGQPRRGKHP